MKDKLFKGIVLGTQIGSIAIFSTLLYKLNKEQKEFKLHYNTLNDIENIEIEKYDKEVNFDSINKQELKSLFVELYNNLLKDPNVNLSNFKRNMESIKIKDINDSEIGQIYDAEAFYDYFDNEVFCNDEPNAATLIHELIHMASTYYGEDAKHVRYCGFLQEKFGHQIGVGITEGYTELLSKRYFNQKKYEKYISDSYVMKMNMVKNLEKIVGKETLTKLYFNSDLKGLIKELKKYNDLESIIKFIKYLDITALDLMHKKSRISKRKYQEYVNYCFEFLIHSYISKLRTQVFNREIDQSQFEDKLNSFIEELNKIEYLSYGEKIETKFIPDKYIIKILKKEENGTKKL